MTYMYVLISVVSLLLIYRLTILVLFFLVMITRISGRTPGRSYGITNDLPATHSGIARCLKIWDVHIVALWIYERICKTKYGGVR